MDPTDCPIFATCNAAVCPLDPAWRKAVHLPGEPVCRYLLASGKAGAADHYRDDPAFAACREHLAGVCDRHPDIARQVRRAAGSGFRGQHLRGRVVAGEPVPGAEPGGAALG